MHRACWSDEDRNEYESLIARCLEWSATADRRQDFLAELDKALETHPCPPIECWAFDVNAEIRDRGAEHVLKIEMARARPRVPVATDTGLIIGKVPREMGRKIRGVEGEVEHQRTIFDFLTWDELLDKAVEFAATAKAATVDRLAVEKLLTLKDRVPEAANPHEACAALGTTVEDFLSGEAVA
jgi:hypothetical protein